MKMKNNKRLLMISYLFPPLGGSGSLRVFKLSKYLPFFKWEPFILTVKNPDYYYAHDIELLNELPKETRIIKSLMIKSAWLYYLFNPFRIRRLDKIIKKFLFHPDEQIGWIPFAILKAKKLISNYHIDAIYSSSGPLSAHIIAYLLKKKTNLPWIADFRDEWFEAPNLELPTKYHKKLHYNLEKKIVQSSDMIIVAAPKFKKFLSKHLKDAKKIITITAGYDPYDFKDIKISDYEKQNIFTISFAGIFYDSFKPISLLQAIEELIQENKIPKKRIKVKFIGGNSYTDLSYPDRFGICEFIGFVSHRMAIKYMTGSSVLLLLLSKKRGEGVIPTKVFEYLASGKPILALVPKDSEVARIIRRSKTGIVADFEDVNEIKYAIMELYVKWNSRDLNFKPDMQVIQHYNIKNITEKFVRYLEVISKKQKFKS